MSGPPKRKCQSSGFFRISSHGPDAGHRRIDQHQPPDALADSCAANWNATMLPMSCATTSACAHARARSSTPATSLGLGLLVEAAGRLGRQAQPAQVGDDHRVVARQLGGQRHPHVAGFAVAVQQHDRRARAARADVDRRAVGGDLAHGEAREGEVLRRRSRRQARATVSDGEEEIERMVAWQVPGLQACARHERRVRKCRQSDALARLA